MATLDLTQDQVAKLAGISQTAVYKLTSGKAKQTRKIVQLAQALQCRAEWLENGTEPMEGYLSGAMREQCTQPTVTAINEITIQQFDEGGRMGNGGLLLQDQPGVIRSWNVSKEWLNLNVKGYGPHSRLCIVTGFGDSMKPMFNPGDPLLVDLSVQIVEYDAVYFFRVDNEGFIKRLQRIPGEGLRVISANREHYDPWVIKPEMDFQVLGRVLKVWKGDDF